MHPEIKMCNRIPLLLTFFLLVFLLSSCAIVEPEQERIRLQVLNNSDVTLENLQVGGLSFENLDGLELSAFQSTERLYINPYLKFDFGDHSFEFIADDYIGDSPLPEGSYTLVISAEEEYGSVYAKIFSAGELQQATMPAGTEKLVESRQNHRAVSAALIDDGRVAIAGVTTTTYLINPTVTDSTASRPPDSGILYIPEARSRVTEETEWLMMTDIRGNNAEMVWSRPTEKSPLFTQRQLLAAEDGGVVLAGSDWRVLRRTDDATYTAGDLLKFDATGTLLWSKTFDSPDFAVALGIIESDDGGYLVIGTREGRTWLMKVDEAGNRQWESRLSSDYYGETALETEDEIVVVGGRFGDGRTSAGGATRVSRQGSQISFSETSNELYGIVEDGDGAIFMSGTEDRMAVLYKMDREGNQVWKKSVSGATHGATLVEAPDGNVVLHGESGNIPALFKLNTAGELLWTREFDITQSIEPDYRNSLNVTREGALLFVGTTFDGIYMATVDLEGNLLFDEKIIP